MSNKDIEWHILRCVTFVHRAKYSDMHRCDSDTDVLARLPSVRDWDV